nr:transporter substrate-binding domain-containing protein [Desulfobulbaceae bacterium]
MTALVIFLSLGVHAQAQDNGKVGAREVVAAFPKNFPPHCFLDEKGEPAGFAIDVLNRVASMINVTVRYKPEHSFVEAVNSLNDGTADLIPNSGVTAERALEYDFTIPVETLNVVLFIRKTSHDIKGLDDLEGRKVAVLPTNVGEQIVRERGNITGVVYSEISTALFDLLAGHVDGFIYPKPAVLKLARQARIDDHFTIVGPPLAEIKRAIRLRKGDPLLDQLNPALKQFLRTKDYQNIYMKWYGKPQPFWTTTTVALTMGAILSLLLFCMFVWRYKSLAHLNILLNKEASIRKEVEGELRTHRDRLEELVSARTSELTESEERFHNLSDAAFEGIVFTEKGRILETNETFCSMFGYQSSELLSMDASDCVTFEERENVKNKILSDYELPYETEGLKKDGTTFPIEVRAKMFTYQGRLASVSAIRDISDKKKAQEKLAVSEAQLKNAQRLAHVGNWSLNLQTNYLEWSDEIYRIFEIEKKKFAASYEAFLDAIHPDDREMVNKAYSGSLTSKIPFSVEHRLLMKDGRIKYVIEQCESYYDNNGDPTSSVGTVQDITKRRTAELELEKLNEELEKRVTERTRQLQITSNDLQDTQRSLMNIVEDLNEKSRELEISNAKLQGLDRLKSLFIASMSHELRTPLNSIIGFSTIVLDEWFGPLNEEQKTKLAIVLRTGKHLLTLINDVIDVSKIEAGKMDSTIEEFDIRDLANEALELVKKDIDDKGLSLQIEVKPKKLHVDRRRLFQCLLNLFSNAVKFTEQGTITMKTSLLKGSSTFNGKDCLQITVSDTGIGIAEKDLPRLFTPFYRLDTPLRVREKGAGLGLYLVKKITEEILQGEVGMESIYGKGSSFFMKIPLVAQTGEENDENSSGG